MMMFCRHCGAELIEGASFCGKCGNVVDIDDQAAIGATAAVAEDAVNSNSAPQPQPAYGETVALKEEPAPAPAFEQASVPEQPQANAGFQPAYQQPGTNFAQPGPAPYAAPDFGSAPNNFGTAPNFGAAPAPGMNQGFNSYEDQIRAQAEMEARIRAEAEARVRMEYEQQRKRERVNAAKKTMQNATGGVLSQLKYFGKFMPEKGIKEVAKIQGGFSWAILLCINWLAFAFGIVIFEREVIGKVIGGVSGAMGGYSSYMREYMAEMRDAIGTFGGWLGTAALVWLVAAGLTVALAFLYVRVLRKKNASFVQILNVVGYATVPVTAILILNMILGLISPFAPIIPLAYIVIYFWILLCIGLNSFIEPADEKSIMPIVLIAIIVVLISLGVLALLGKAVIENGTAGGLGSFDLSDLF